MARICIFYPSETVKISTKVICTQYKWNVSQDDIKHLETQLPPSQHHILRDFGQFPFNETIARSFMEMLPRIYNLTRLSADFDRFFEVSIRVESVTGIEYAYT